jgi:two-component system, cell cycle sensor histidine kinase and response regulator CckA
METAEGPQTEASAPEPEQLVGLAARALAHDFNNLLAAIAGHASYLRMLAEPGSEMDETAATIEMVAVRAKGLAAQLHQLGSAQAPVRVPLIPVDLHCLVNEVVATLRTGQASPAQFSVLLSATRPVVRGDAGQLHQLVMNLAVNACEAMGANGGEVAIGTTTTEQGGLLLEVRDSGPGIPAGLREQIFDIAYSTKLTGGGMGLDIVRRVAANHGAGIEIADNQPRGAVFRLRFPSA